MKETGVKLAELVDSDGDVAAIDSFTNSLASINVFHYKIHAGNAYRAWHFKSTIANSATYDILLSVPAATFPHLRKAALVTAGPFNVDFYEGATTSNDGTAIPTFNVNRNSSNTAGTDVFYTPTITDAGTQIDYCYISGDKKEAGSSRDMVEETVLKPSTKYLCRFTNNSGGNADLVVHMAFYE